MSVYQNHYLEHYGIPGMKWGQRRAKNAASLKKKSGAKQKNGKKTAIKILTFFGGGLIGDLMFGSVYGFNNTMSGRAISIGAKQANKILFKRAVYKTIKNL